MKIGKISTLTLAIALGLSAGLSAQESDADQEASNSDEQSADLGSIEVTARRRTEKICAMFRFRSPRFPVRIWLTQVPRT